MEKRRDDSENRTQKSLFFGATKDRCSISGGDNKKMDHILANYGSSSDDEEEAPTALPAKEEDGASFTEGHFESV